MAVEMPFDIDDALDQLEKKLNQSDHKENETNKIIQTSSILAAPRKSVDEILLLDLDPLGNPENRDCNDSQDDDDKLERIKQDLEELYASSVVINTSSIPTSSLPDLIGQQDDLSTTTLPLAVEQLELEVRQEILQHTVEASASSFASPDVTNIGNDHLDDHKKDSVVYSSSPISDEIVEQEEKQDVKSLLENEAIQASTDLSVQVEPDIIQHEIPSTHAQIVLHSVDSIVNAPMGSKLDDFSASSPIPNEPMPLQLTSDVFFTACDEGDEKSVELTTEDPIIESFVSSSIPSHSTNELTSTGSIQDFDLVKNVLSEMFDKNEDENLDENPIEEKESELVNIEEPQASPPLLVSSLTANNDDDFRFLDEMIAGLEGTDADIHQLTSAEIDRVDNLLKEIVNAHQAEAASSSATTDGIESCPTDSVPLEEPPIPPMDSSESHTEQLAAAAAASSTVPVDEELIRVEQEWAKLTEEERMLGSVAPEWVSDDQAPACMKCAAKFSITRRRHHCRACGKVFCSTCCWQKVKLIHDDSKEDRACNDCIKTINHVEYLWNYMRNNQKPRSSVLRKRTGKTFIL